MEDRELVRGALAGRREDFEVLVERYQRVLYQFVHRYLRDEAAADEVVQETFVQAYTHLARFRGEATFKTWLHQIALNHCRNVHRVVRRRRETSLDDVDETKMVVTDDTSERNDSHARLEALVARLPPRQRAVLSLRLFSDLPFKEIARVEGITENTAKVNYHHAVTRLREWLSQEES